MAANILTKDQETWATHASENGGAPLEADQEVLSTGGVVAAVTVVVAAVLLAATPVVVAVLAIVSPADLDRPFRWLLGGSAAFSLVAAGRVPAAALLAIALAGRRTRP
jgi:hypothetical protein